VAAPRDKRVIAPSAPSCTSFNNADSRPSANVHDNGDGTFAAVCGGCGHAGHLDRHTIERMVINACNGDMGFEF
jgi:hypothetical protein